MAIRIGLPPVVFPRLRLRWHVTWSLVAHHTRALREAANRTAAVPQVWWQRASERWGAGSIRRARALAREHAQLACFEEQYEELIDMLCWAAKDGVHTDRDMRYAELRAWMCRNYRMIRPRLRPYWVEPEAPESYDPFEALFAPENVDEILNASTSIEDMMLTRAALDAYRTELEARSHLS